MKLLVTIGFHTCQGEETFDFKTAGILLIDWTAKKVLKEFEYVSPPENTAMPGRMLFHSGQLNGSQLVVTTSSEVVFFNTDTWKIDKVITHKWFNDLHHAVIRGNDLFVCNTGLQAVHRMSLDGEMLDTWSVVDKPVWDTYDPEVDYRPLDTKPHEAHPNHLYFVDDELWVTRCQLQDTVKVQDIHCRTNIAVGRPHDGNPVGDLVWFTTINGNLMGMNVKTGIADRPIDLNTIDTNRGQLGWCRGVRHIDDDTALVAFSQFRPSKHKDFIHWIMGDGKNRLPSRISLFDLKNRRMVEEMPFKGKLEGAAIYSIFVLD